VIDNIRIIPYPNPMLIEKSADQRTIYSVSEITRNIKTLVQGQFPDVWVRGEISNCRKASSGHIYFTLKDEKAVIRAVLFRGHQKGIQFELEDGMNVIVHGGVDVFEKRGEYQIIVEFLEPEGIGALQLAFEQLKEKLGKEGLFDDAHKKTIPSFPDTVGVITSPTGAALRDILNVMGRRYRGVHIIIYPVPVQGEGAAEEIASAIRKANLRDETDVLILGRGGGSIEDLWPFNEETVARAIYESRIPVISAVGHEIDFTISDYAADLRAPTPSAAAELVVKNRQELLRWFRDLFLRLKNSTQRALAQKKQLASYHTSDVLFRMMQTILNEKNFALDDVTKTMLNSMESVRNAKKARFERIAGQLDTLSPLKTLARGYAMVRKLPEDVPLFSIENVGIGNETKTRLRDGELFSTVNKKEKTGPNGD
jgi:exodeoxyribonuclease VII large subunit